MLDRCTQSIRTSFKYNQIKFLLFPRETSIVGSLAGTEVDLGGDDDITATEL